MEMRRVQLTDYSVVTRKSKLTKEMWLNTLFHQDPLCVRSDLCIGCTLTSSRERLLTASLRQEASDRRTAQRVAAPPSENVIDSARRLELALRRANRRGEDDVELRVAERGFLGRE